jgi:hypothetical protein
MLVKDPFKLLEGKLPTPIELTFDDAKRIIRSFSSNINRVASGTIKRDGKNIQVVTAKVFHGNEGLLAEYKIIPEIIINPDGTIHHIMRGLYIYGGMPPNITVHVEEENSGLRCIDFRVFGIKMSVWGPIEEVKEIVEAVELARLTKEAIIERLELDGIHVY